MRRQRSIRFRSAACAGALLLALTPRPALAEPDPCASGASVSPCFDADPLWLPAHGGTFATLGSPAAVPLGGMSLIAAASLSERPVALILPSPHPDGIEVDVVERTSTFTLGVGFGLGQGFDLRLALPLVPYQKGSGAGAVTAEQAPPLERTGVRDPRVALGWEALTLDARTLEVVAGGRFELTAPLGDESSFGGASGPAAAPALAGELRAGRFFFGLDLGLRLRRAVRFGNVRKGSEAALSAGIAVELAQAPRLSLGVESSLRPPLVTAPSDGARDLPGEWLGVLRLAWGKQSPYSLVLGGGTGLPLAAVPKPGGGSESAFGVTAPAFRALVALRFATPAE